MSFNEAGLNGDTLRPSLPGWHCARGQLERRACAVNEVSIREAKQLNCTAHYSASVLALITFTWQTLDIPVIGFSLSRQHANCDRSFNR
jgi:hypothetical protein